MAAAVDDPRRDLLLFALGLCERFRFGAIVDDGDFRLVGCEFPTKKTK